jgi:hypothetical protein
MTDSEQHLDKIVQNARALDEGKTPASDLWPAIRGRIERSKVVAMPELAGHAAPRPARSRRTLAWIGAGVAAAVAFFVLGRASSHGITGAPDVQVVASPTVTSVADSGGAYEEQARILFDRLSLERSLLRPEALKQIDRDLQVVDAAIAELDAAVARDPNNPVLRRLLVSSYREKVDILKRVGNAE